MEIRGDLRDTVDDLTEHNVECIHGNVHSCPRVQMHAAEIAEYILDQPDWIQQQLQFILGNANMMVTKSRNG